MYKLILSILSLYFSVISITAMERDRIPSNQKDLRTELSKNTTPTNKRHDNRQRKSKEKFKTQSRIQERRIKEIINDLNW